MGKSATRDSGTTSFAMAGNPTGLGSRATAASAIGSDKSPISALRSRRRQSAMERLSKKQRRGSMTSSRRSRGNLSADDGLAFRHRPWAQPPGRERLRLASYPRHAVSPWLEPQRPRARLCPRLGRSFREGSGTRFRSEARCGPDSRQHRIPRRAAGLAGRAGGRRHDAALRALVSRRQAAWRLAFADPDPVPDGGARTRPSCSPSCRATLRNQQDRGRLRASAQPS